MSDQLWFNYLALIQSTGTLEGNQRVSTYFFEPETPKVCQSKSRQPELWNYVSLVRCAQSKGTLIKQCEKLFTKALMHNGIE